LLLKSFSSPVLFFYVSCFIVVVDLHSQHYLCPQIAETSITIDGIRFVIDPGMVKQKKYVPATGMESLQVVPVSKAQAWQRAGRAGRQAPGQCYRLYTESTFRTLDAATVPEILRCSLATVILQLKVLGVKDVLTFDFLQPPEASSLKRSLQQLRSLGALNRVAHQEEMAEMAEMATGTKKQKNNKKRSKRYVLTDLGRRMSELPLEPHYALALIRSSQDDLHCSENMLTIISMLSVENVFVSPSNQREKSGQRHRRFAAPSGDHVTLLNLYSCYMEECPNGRNAKQWLSENYINARAMHRAIKVRQQLVERCHQIGIPIVSPEPGTDPDDEAVRRGLVAGLFLHMAKMMPSIDTNTNKKNSNRHKFKTCADNIQTNIHPSSTLFTRRNQQKMLKKGASGGGAYFVVFTELVYTKRAYIRGVSEIKQEWLMELAPQVFSSSK
jgi:HrpA-like RNA helicase